MMLIRGWVTIAVLAFSLVLPSLCLADIVGMCSICHTMHNSKMGVPVAYTVNPDGGIEHQRCALRQSIENRLHRLPQQRWS